MPKGKDVKEKSKKSKEKEVKEKGVAKGKAKEGSVKYAENEAAVYEWFNDQGHPLELLPERDQGTVVRIAMDSDNGLKVALDSVLADITEQQDQAAIQRRTRTIKGEYDTWSGRFGNDLANDVFEQAHYTYTHGTQSNPSLGGRYTQDKINEAMDAWKGAAGVDKNLTRNITNIHGYKRQDKEAKGKGNEGDTLGRRKLQANFISIWHGRKINIHVNIKE